MKKKHLVSFTSKQFCLFLVKVLPVEPFVRSKKHFVEQKVLLVFLRDCDITNVCLDTIVKQNVI